MPLEYVECPLEPGAVPYWTYLFGVDGLHTVMGLTDGNKLRFSSDSNCTTPGLLAGNEGESGLVRLESHVHIDDETGRRYRTVEVRAAPNQAKAAEKLADFLASNIIGVDIRIQTIFDGEQR